MFSEFNEIKCVNHLTFSRRLQIFNRRFIDNEAQNGSIKGLNEKVEKCTIIWGFLGSSAGKEYTCNEGDPSSVPGLGSAPGEEIVYTLQYSWVSPVAQMVKNPPAMWETWVQSQGWGNPQKNPHGQRRAPQSMGSQRVGHD